LNSFPSMQYGQRFLSMGTPFVVELFPNVAAAPNSNDELLTDR
jgi:hypothetical protein